MLRSLPTPLLLTLVGALGAANVAMSASAHADGENTVPALVPNQIPATAFLTGPQVQGSTTYEGLEVELQRTEANDHLEVVFNNPTPADVQISLPAEVIRMEGNMASRMGPMPMSIAMQDIALTVPAQGEASFVFNEVTLPEVRPDELQLLSFSSTSVVLDSQTQLVFSDAAAAVEAVMLGNSLSPVGSAAENVALLTGN